MVISLGRDKRKIEKFPPLPGGIDEKVPDIQKLPAMIKAHKKLEKLRSDLKEIESQIAGYRYYPSAGDELPAKPAADLEEQAAAYLQSGKLPDVKNVSVDVDREKLFHRRRIIQKAIQHQQTVLGELENKLIQQTCKEIEDIAQEFAAETVAAFEKVKIALEKAEKFYHLLARRGIRQDRRPEHWQSLLPL